MNEDLTTTQKIYRPVARLNAAHARTVNNMVSAYERGDAAAGRKQQRYLSLIEAKLTQAYQRVRRYLLSKVQ